MKTIKVLFFANLRDRVGMRSAELQIPAQTNIAALKSILVEKFPALNGLLSHTLTSMNQEYVFDDAIILDHAEIALFPPVSGG